MSFTRERVDGARRLAQEFEQLQSLRTRDRLTDARNLLINPVRKLPMGVLHWFPQNLRARMFVTPERFELLRRGPSSSPRSRLGPSRRREGRALPPRLALHRSP